MKRLLIGTALLGASFVPLIPGETLTFRYAYEAPCSAFIQPPSPTSTPAKRTGYVPTQCTDFVFVAAFEDSKGRIIYSEIDQTRYRAMGREGGAKDNPTKTEYESFWSTVLPQAQAAVPALNGSIYHGSAAAASITVSTTVNSGLTDSLLIAITSVNTATPSAGSITGCTWNGSAMTVGSTIITTLATTETYFFYAPAATTANVVCSFDVAHVGDLETFVLTGAKQSGQFDATAGKSLASTDTSASQALTTVSNDTLVIDHAHGSNGPITVSSYGGGQTELYQYNDGSGDLRASSYIAKTTAGSITTSMTFSDVIGTSNSYSNFSVTPSVVSAPAIPIKVPDIIMFD